MNFLFQILLVLFGTIHCLWCNERIFGEILDFSSQKFAVTTLTSDSEAYSLYRLKSGDLDLKLILGNRPYYDSILPTARDLYLGYGDSLVASARFLNRDKSEVGQGNSHSHEPREIILGNQSFVFGGFYFLEEAADPRPVLGITTLYKHYPMYVTGRMNEDIDEPLVRKILNMIWSDKE